jgi:hypothetical protein
MFHKIFVRRKNFKYAFKKLTDVVLTVLTFLVKQTLF